MPKKVDFLDRDYIEEMLKKEETLDHKFKEIMERTENYCFLMDMEHCDHAGSLESGVGHIYSVKEMEDVKMFGRQDEVEEELIALNWLDKEWLNDAKTINIWNFEIVEYTEAYD